METEEVGVMQIHMMKLMGPNRMDYDSSTPYEVICGASSKALQHIQRVASQATTCRTYSMEREKNHGSFKGVVLFACIWWEGDEKMDVY